MHDFAKWSVSDTALVEADFPKLITTEGRG